MRRWLVQGWNRLWPSILVLLFQPAVPVLSTKVDATCALWYRRRHFDPNEPVVDIYNLYKFQRSNQSTCINQKPLVKVGDKV